MNHRLAQFAIASLMGGFAAGVGAQSHEAGSQQAPPADSEWVAQKTQTCAGCHGKKGVSQTANFPILAGQYKSYLLHAMTAYRDGGRQNAIMGGQLKGMSDAQLAALARYYNKQTTPLYTPEPD